MIGHCLNQLRSKAGRPEVAERHFRNMVQANLAPNLVTYNTLISAWAKVAKPQKALELLEELKAHGLTPSVVTYSAIVNAWAKASNPEEAEQCVEMMKRAGVMPNTVTYNTVLSAWTKAKQPLKVESTMRSMRAARIPADDCSYNLVINAMCSAGLPDRAEAWLWEASSQKKVRMKKRAEAEAFLGKMKRHGVAPVSACYNLVIEAWADATAPETAERLLDSMAKDGCTPDANSYNCIIAAWNLLGDADRAAALELRKSQIVPASACDLPVGARAPRAGQRHSFNARAPYRVPSSLSPSETTPACLEPAVGEYRNTTPKVHRKLSTCLPARTEALPAADGVEVSFTDPVSDACVERLQRPVQLRKPNSQATFFEACFQTVAANASIFTVTLFIITMLLSHVFDVTFENSSAHIAYILDSVCVFFATVGVMQVTQVKYSKPRKKI